MVTLILPVTAGVSAAAIPCAVKEVEAGAVGLREVVKE
jgi:hypothetical protein